MYVKGETLSFVTIWLNREGVKLSEHYRAHDSKYYDLSYVKCLKVKLTNRGENGGYQELVLGTGELSVKWYTISLRRNKIKRSIIHCNDKR